MKPIQDKLSEYDIYPWLIFASVTTATFMTNVDASILNVALPVLEDYFSAGPQTLQWVISGYLLVITSILPAVGKLSDIKGRKKMFMIGLSIFTFGSFLSALSATVWQLVAFRIIQGVGGAIMQGNVMSIVAYTFPPGRRGKALGAIGSVVAAGTIVGPALGGFLIHQFGWQAIFWVNVPIGILGIVGTYILLPPDQLDDQQERLDYAGSAIFFVAMTALLLYVSQSQEWGFRSVASLTSLIIAIVAWIGFVYWENRVKIPLIDLSFFKNPTFTIGNFAGYVSYVLIMFPSILLPLYLHHVVHVSVDQIGFLMTAQAIAMMIAAPIAGWLSDRVGHDIPSVIGMGLTAISLWMMGQFDTTTQPFHVVLALSLFGIGVGLFQSPNNVSILESVPVGKTGVTGGIIATVRNFGRVSGVAVAVFLFQWMMGASDTVHQYVESVSFVFLFGSGLAVVTLLVLISRLRVSLKKKKELY
ncbi:MFS transporter [Tepidibacillus fermentans]|uniref:EmrB/QacA subfamily drug resistance transporter n=1 Tax=Tepidibacillus fermentans TaxID=1281767 RepID=A0A4R3KLR9_9BACI|nr:MFS transporter [Tepidibacillus fermentans]TCS84540.1 EmrB/QacA subfamily drug resistance transporter [Tepidibacillus fermentans]